MDPRIALKDYKDELELLIAEFMQDKLARYQNLSKFFDTFLDFLSEYTLRGGKRLRPALLYYSYLLFNNEKTLEVKKLSVYLELLQSFLLIHDDIMDRGQLRRGKKTMHKLFEDYSAENKLNDDFHFGNTMAILSGDLACQFSFLAVNESEFNAEKKNKIIQLLNEELVEIVYGQSADIMLTYTDKYVFEDIIDVHIYKTAKYTFRVPIFSGAVLGDATPEQLKVLEEYSLNCGIAFQIRDDIIGVFGKDEETGKETVSDIAEGKKTLLVLKAYEKATTEEKAQLDSLIGKKDLSIDELKSVQKIIEKTGSLEFSVSECVRYVELGKQALKKLDISPENQGVQFLNGIADYLVVRNY